MASKGTKDGLNMHLILFQTFSYHLCNKVLQSQNLFCYNTQWFSQRRIYLLVWIHKVCLELSLNIFSVSYNRRQILQNNNDADFKDTTLDRPTPEDKSSPSEAITPEAIVKGKTDSEASDFDDTSAASDMYKKKPAAAEPAARGQAADQAAAQKRGVRGAAESRHTTASGTKTPTSAAGNKAKNVPTKAKGSTEGTKVETSSDNPTQSDAAVVMLPALKDQSASAPSGAAGSKSKIPKRSTSDADVKSPVTPDKTSAPDTSGHKLQKQPRTKDTLKSPTTAARPGRKPSFEETKGGKLVSGNISPTKTRTGTKLSKDKSDEDFECVNLLNDVENEQRSSKTGHPPHGESPDVKKTQQQNDVESSPKSRLPVSSPTRKKVDITYKRVSSGQMDSDRPKAVQKTSREQKDATADESPGSETPPPESPKKGKKARIQHVGPGDMGGGGRCFCRNTPNI